MCLVALYCFRFLWWYWHVHSYFDSSVLHFPWFYFLFFYVGIVPWQSMLWYSSLFASLFLLVVHNHFSLSIVLFCLGNWLCCFFVFVFVVSIMRGAENLIPNKRKGRIVLSLTNSRCIFVFRQGRKRQSCVCTASWVALQCVNPFICCYHFSCACVTLTFLFVHNKIHTCYCFVFCRCCYGIGIVFFRFCSDS